MRIAIMGAGAVGGYFGARLAATRGAEVHFIARGPASGGHPPRRPAHRERGRPLHLTDVRATDDPATIGPVDLVLFAVKLWDTDRAAEACRPLVKPGTVVVTVQNGVTGLDTLCQILGREHVAGGVAHIGATIAAPGVIRHTGTLARLTYGELDGRPSPRLTAFHALAEAAGFEAVLSAAILRAQWEKFAFLAPFSGVTALTRQPAGVIRRVPESRALFLDAVAEVARLARARDVDLGTGIVARVETLLDGLPPAMTSSMLNDLTRGGRLELPWLSGAVVQLGSELGGADARPPGGRGGPGALRRRPAITGHPTGGGVTSCRPFFPSTAPPATGGP
ncbi:MAG: 2-dehydropantoate 2-reductase [Magnetospirillum sp.]|nr:2-dehydropantoate 2-reductase [Magnetospirillum sp.]